MCCTQAVLTNPAVPAGPALIDDDPVTFPILVNPRTNRVDFTHPLVAIALRVFEPLCEASLVSPVLNTDRCDMLSDYDKAFAWLGHTTLNNLRTAFFNAQNPVAGHARLLVGEEVRERRAKGARRTIQLIREASQVDEVERLLRVLLVEEVLGPYREFPGAGIVHE